MPVPAAQVYGHPVDDPTLDLHWWLYPPNPAIYGPGPYPVFMGTHAGGFQDGGAQSLNIMMEQMSADGFLGVTFECRLMKPEGPGLQGQTTDGKFEQQTDDCDLAIATIRADARCIGFVNGFGGSGSAHHALYKTLIGTNRYDAAVALSPVTDMSDREDDVPPGSPFIQKTVAYARTSDLPTLRARSPIAAVDLNQPPIYIANGITEPMPYSQFNRFVEAMDIAGVTNYFARTNDNPGTHSFQTWDENGPVVRPWVRARYLEWLEINGGPPPPPPPPPGTGEFVTAEITGLDPSEFLTLTVRAVDKVSGLIGEPASYDFLSDRDTAGGGTIRPAPRGVYVLLPSPGGIPGDITGRPWLGFDYVDGSRYSTNWSIVNPNLNVYNWTDIDNYLVACANAGKLAGLSIAAGVFTPAWLYHRGAQGFNVTTPAPGLMPVPWDDTYLRQFKIMIRAFAERYLDNESISYVVLGGLGQVINTFVVADEDYAALNTLAINAGYANVAEGWAFGAQQLMSYWTKAFRNNRCFIQLDYPVPASQFGLGALQDLTDWAITSFHTRFGMMTDKLTGATLASDPLDMIMSDATSTNPLGYQFAFPSTDPRCDPTQDPGSYDPETGLRNAAEAGIDVGAFFEEFYESDILTATDPYPADFDTFQTALYNNA